MLEGKASWSKCPSIAQSAKMMGWFGIAGLGDDLYTFKITEQVAAR